MDTASLEIGRAKIGHGIQNWTHQDRPEFVYPILHFPTPNPTPFSGLLDALKQTLNATLKKMDAIRFFGNVSFFFHFSKLFKHTNLDAGPFENWTRKNIGRGVKKTKIGRAILGMKRLRF